MIQATGKEKEGNCYIGWKSDSEGWWRDALHQPEYLASCHRNIRQ
jgi:hypothetical protein